MKQIFLLLLVLLIFFIPCQGMAQSVGGEFNVFRLLDQLLALPFKLINAILGAPQETTLPSDVEATPVMI